MGLRLGWRCASHRREHAFLCVLQPRRVLLDYVAEVLADEELYAGRGALRVSSCLLEVAKEAQQRSFISLGRDGLRGGMGAER